MEPTLGGHHAPYLTWMVEGFLKQGIMVTAIVGGDHDDKRLQVLSELTHSYHEQFEMIQIEPVGIPRSQRKGVLGLLAREYAFWKLFKGWCEKYCESKSDSIIFLPYADYCLYAVGLLGSPFGKHRWAALTMRPSFHYQEMGVLAPEPSFAQLKRRLFFRLLTQPLLIRLLSIDEPLVEYASKVSDKAKGKVTLFPEPVDLGPLPSKIESKRRLELNVEHLTVLLYGALTVRKGVSVLLRAAASREFPANVDVLLAGRVSDEETRKLLSLPWVGELVAQGRLKIIDRFISAAEEPALFSAADIAWLGYQGHYNSSGVLVQAIKAYLPVVGFYEGIIGWKIRRYNLGAIIRSTKEGAVISAINESAERSFRQRCSRLSGEYQSPPSICDAQKALIFIVFG